ncbi:MAG TPA: alkaline phosphatase [Chthoniobacteraceae bacterium]|jgi:alkaline phosphatase|nr:alkaline phosphatase [Chthoniobacteraceae bacterium]
MKLRNQLLALFCMMIFAAAGYLYVQKWVVQKPFGIILFVSDGLVVRQLTMARHFEGGADHRLALESFPNVALLRNAPNDYAVPDDAAAATALATGVRGNHHMLSVDPAGNPVESIAALARKKGRSFGVVTNGSLCNPVPAAFYAHAVDAQDQDALAVQLVEFRPDVALGGGQNSFVPGQGEAGVEGGRADGRNLLIELAAKKAELVHNKAELEGIYQADSLVGLFAPRSLAYSNQIESGSNQPSLADMVRKAISMLQKNPKGYLLVVDAALVGNAAGNNEAERTIGETVALDHAVSTALKYAGAKSLFLAVGKHSTGGLSLNGYPLRGDYGLTLLGANAAGYPYLTWATGPNGPNPAPAGAAPGAATLRKEPAAFQTGSAMNNAEDVVALGLGRGSEGIKGFMDNTAIFEVLKGAL